jgi:Predicted transcription factor, homolog of eukaryotic MBF1
MDSTANKIYKLRTEQGLTRAELSRKMQVSKTTIQKWEQGLTVPRREKIAELSKILGVSEPYLLGFSKFENESEFMNEAMDRGEIITALLDLHKNDIKEKSSAELYTPTQDIFEKAHNITSDEWVLFQKINYIFLLMTDTEREAVTSYSEFLISQKKTSDSKAINE